VSLGESVLQIELMDTKNNLPVNSKMVTATI